MNTIVVAGLTSGLSLAVLFSTPVLSAPPVRSVAQVPSSQSTDVPSVSSQESRTDGSGLSVNRLIGQLAIAKSAEEKWRQAIQENPNNAEAHWELAGALGELGRYRDAEAIYQRAIQLAPGNEAAYLAYGAFLSRQNRVSDRVALYQQAVERVPESASIHWQLANSLEDASAEDWPNQVAEIEAAYRRAVRLDPEKTFYDMSLAEHLIRQDRFTEAVTVLERVVRRQPQSDIQTYGALAWAAEKASGSAAAESVYRAAIASQPENLEMYSLFANWLLINSRGEEAEAFYEATLEKFPDSQELYESLGIHLSNEGKLEKAEALYKQAIERDLANELIYIKLGDLLTLQSRYAEAEAAYRNAMARSQSGDAYSRLADFLNYTGRREETIALFQQAIQQFPQENKFYNILAELLENEGRIDDAIAVRRQGLEIPRILDMGNVDRLAALLMDKAQYAEVVGLYEKYNTGHYNLDSRMLERWQTALREIGRASEAETLEADLFNQTAVFSEARYREAIALSPESGYFYAQLGDALADQGRRKEAEAAYQDALRLGHEAFGTHIKLGRLYFERGDFELAEATYQTALDRYPEKDRELFEQEIINLYEYLGALYQATGEAESAIAFYQKALDISPSWPGIAEKITELQAQPTERDEENVNRN